MTIPRRHHYVPRGYLRAFTRAGTEMIHFVDFAAKRTDETNILNICVQRDFNRVTVAGEPPDVLEKELSTLESGFAGALGRVIDARSPCDPETWNWVLNLMSILAARHPLVRAEVEREKDQWLRDQLKAVYASPETWAESCRQAMLDGFLTEEQARRPYEHSKRFADEDRFAITFTHGHLTEVEFKLQDTVLRNLVKRRWTILSSADSQARFVTTDRPVSLMHRTGTSDPAVAPRTWDSTDSIVLFPLSPGLIAHGAPAGDLGLFQEQARTIPRELVGEINGKLLERTYTSIFAQSDVYLIGREVFTGEKLLSVVLGPPGRRTRGHSR